MSGNKENQLQKQDKARGLYRIWSHNAMRKALTDCNAGMGVRESSRVNNVPRGELRCNSCSGTLLIKNICSKELNSKYIVVL